MKASHLHDLFDKYPEMNPAEFVGKCHDCGIDTTVEITLSEDGFNISGGALYYDERNSYRMKCDKCHEAQPDIVVPPNVYSRIVGYLQPTKQWNDGKVAEFKKRKMFDLGSVGE